MTDDVITEKSRERARERVVDLLETILGDRDAAKRFVTDNNTVILQCKDKEYVVKPLFFVLNSLLPEEFIRNYLPIAMYLTSAIKEIQEEYNRYDIINGAKIAKAERGISAEEDSTYLALKRADESEIKEVFGLEVTKRLTDAEAKKYAKQLVFDDLEDLEKKKTAWLLNKEMLRTQLKYLRDIRDTITVYVESFTESESLMTVSQTYKTVQDLLQELQKNKEHYDTDTSNSEFPSSKKQGEIKRFQ